MAGLRVIYRAPFGNQVRLQELVPALGISCLVFLAGCAILRLSIRIHAAEERAALEQSVDAAGDRLEQEFERLFGVALQSARYAGQSAAEARPQGDSKDPWLLAGYAAQWENPSSRILSVSSLTAIRSQLGLAENTSGPEISGPFRAGDGSWVAIVRIPTLERGDAELIPAPRWFGAATPLDTILRAAKLQDLREQGYDYVLQAADPVFQQSRPVFRTTELALDAPASRPLRFTGNQWVLSAAPQDRAAGSARTGTSVVLISIFTLIAGVFTYDSAGSFGRLKQRLGTNAERLKSTRQQLIDAKNQRLEIEKQFAHAAFHDVLTGLPNRRYFINRLERGLGRLRRKESDWIAILILNLDRFKAVNETKGYAVGDEVILQTVKRIEETFRPSDMVTAKLTGDEFAILLFDIPDPEAVIAAVTRLQDKLALPYVIDGQTVFLTGCVGVALASSGYEQAEELLRESDFALSQAKALGRSKYAVFDASSRDQLITYQQIETDLHKALEKGELQLRFQPIVSLTTGRLVGMESLMRWQHPVEGMISPGRFMRIAEESGMIVAMTRWALKQACVHARGWRQRLPADVEFYVSVNLSAQDLKEVDLCDYVGGVVRESGLPDGTIRLEVTESILIGDIQAASELVSRFRQMKIPLLLDDFGTGYSSLSYLNRFRFDYLKIDQSFVSAMASPGQNPGILNAIIHLAKDLGIRTIAEGIEDAETMRALRERGCDYGQGYFFSKPIAPEEAEKLLLSRRVW